MFVFSIALKFSTQCSEH